MENSTQLLSKYRVQKFLENAPTKKRSFHSNTDGGSYQEMNLFFRSRIAPSSRSWNKMQKLQIKVYAPNKRKKRCWWDSTRSLSLDSSLTPWPRVVRAAIVTWWLSRVGMEIFSPSLFFRGNPHVIRPRAHSQIYSWSGLIESPWDMQRLSFGQCVHWCCGVLHKILWSSCGRRQHEKLVNYKNYWLVVNMWKSRAEPVKRPNKNTVSWTTPSSLSISISSLCQADN